MLYLFEYDTLILLNAVKTSEKVEKIESTFKYPLYGKKAKTVFLLHYKTLKDNWLPPAHQELFEKIILSGFNYTLDKVVAYNVQEVIQNEDIHFIEKPDTIFYMDNKLLDTVEKWITKQGIEHNLVRYLPSLTQMIENQKFKQQAWKEIKDYRDMKK